MERHRLGELATAAGATWIAACADGSWWQGNAAELTVTLPDGVTSSNFVLTDTIGYFSAASRYAAFFLAIDLNVRMLGISMACFGLMDQPAETWPSMSADELSAYTAISNFCSITDPAGFRSAYANLNESLDDLALRLTMMTCPTGIDATAFATVQTQLQAELSYAENVRNLFTNLSALNTDLGLQQTQTYAEVVQMVGLPAQPSSQPSSPVEVIFGMLVSKLLTKAISIAPAPAQSVISLGMSRLQLRRRRRGQKSRRGRSQFRRHHRVLAARGNDREHDHAGSREDVRVGDDHTRRLAQVAGVRRVDQHRRVVLAADVRRHRSPGQRRRDEVQFLPDPHPREMADDGSLQPLHFRHHVVQHAAERPRLFARLKNGAGQ